MKRLERLRKANPHLTIYTVHDPEFCQFGRVLNNLNATPLVEVVTQMEMPIEGSKYVPWLDDLDIHPLADIIRQRYWGDLDAQIGLCWGHSGKLNALEWHTSSEINIGVTDLVLMLADLRNIEQDRLNSATVKLFYLAKYEAIEVYATTMHFCPCQVTPKGFSCIVSLPRGTNTPLTQAEKHDRWIWAKNKWLIAHEQNEPLLQRGAWGGIYGANWALEPIAEEES